MNSHRPRIVSIEEIDAAEPHDGFVPPGVAAPTMTRKMVLEWFDDAATLALADPSQQLIEDFLDEGAMSIFYGEFNAGKTFIVLDLAFAISAGLPWNGKQAKRGLVVYLCAEGGRRIMRRVAALKHQNSNPPEKPLLALVRFPIDLRSNDANVKELLVLVRKAEAQCGALGAWIIVDTLSRAMAGGDENSAVDMGRIVQAADFIRAETGAHFSYVHHCGKDAARGARGHSLLRAATDTEIEVTAGTIRVAKQRDMESGASFAFSLVDAPLGEDANGRAIKSAVVKWSDAPAPESSKRTPSVPASQRLLMDVLREAIDEARESFRPYGQSGPLVRAAPEAAVRKLYYARIAEAPKSDDTALKLADRQKKNVANAIKRTLDAKIVAASAHNGERFLWLAQ